MEYASWQGGEVYARRGLGLCNAQLCTIMHNYAKLCTAMRAALQRRHTGIANKREPGIAIPHKQTAQ